MDPNQLSQEQLDHLTIDSVEVEEIELFTEHTMITLFCFLYLCKVCVEFFF